MRCRSAPSRAVRLEAPRTGARRGRPQRPERAPVRRLGDGRLRGRRPGDAGERRPVGESSAGHPAAARVDADTAVRISTGAALPAGADAVVPVRAGPGKRTRRTGARRRRRRERALRGEDVRPGDVVLRAGTIVSPAEVGIAAAVGRPGLRCAERPRAALLLTDRRRTGRARRAPAPGRIYGSNGYALGAQLAMAGASIVRRETVPDSRPPRRGGARRALTGVDRGLRTGASRSAPTTTSSRRCGRSAWRSASRA